MTVRVTWWGHATTTVHIGGRTVLTDPLFATRLVHLRRVGSPAPPAAAAQADAVLVSHLHPDHLHVPSLRQVPASARLVVPGGGARLVRAMPAPVTQVVPGDTIEVGGEVIVRAVPALHDGRRLPGSPHRGPALGYVIEHDGFRVWFAGDTGLYDAMADIGPVDVAIVPVGGWGPTLGAGHLDPAQAAQAVARVSARFAVPMHYGTFWPVGLRAVAPGTFARSFTEPGARFAAAMADRPTDAAVHVLAPGETVSIDG